MNAYRSQERINGEITTIVSNNANFVKGKPGEPLLISWDDATTMFHEFGHALHGLNSERHLSVAFGHGRGARLRRVPFPVDGALAGDAGGAAKVCRSLSNRQTDSAGAGRQDQTLEDFQSGLRDG